MGGTWPVNLWHSYATETALNLPGSRLVRVAEPRVLGLRKLTEVVRKRFEYRTPGLFVLAVRVFRLAHPEIRPERPEYAGCKTWVTLDEPVPTDGAEPVAQGEGI